MASQDELPERCKCGNPNIVEHICENCGVDCHVQNLDEKWTPEKEAAHRKKMRAHRAYGKWYV